MSIITAIDLRVDSDVCTVNIDSYYEPNINLINWMAPVFDWTLTLVFPRYLNEKELQMNISKCYRRTYIWNADVYI